MTAICGAWLLAGTVAPLERWLGRVGSLSQPDTDLAELTRPTGRSSGTGPGRKSGQSAGVAVRAVLVTFLLAAGILYISVIGFGTWWGRGALGIPGSSIAALGLLAGLWWRRPGRRADPGRVDHDDSGATGSRS